jgi:peroxiredoxin 2/4
MSLVGTLAPQFRMTSTKDLDSLDQDVVLEDYRGRWVLLIFYPGDFTTVCPTEIVAFSSRAGEFAAEDTDLIAISTDSVYCHQAWQEFALGRLAIPLASDPTLAVSRDYGVLIESDCVAQRASFILDPGGVVRYEVIHDGEVGRSVDESLRVLQALRMETYVPADWQPGQATLATAG